MNASPRNSSDASAAEAAENDAADSVEALSETVAQLRAERDGLHRAMRNRAVIEQAKGALSERLSMSPETAFERLVERSTQSNVKVADIAAAVIAYRVPEPPSVSEVSDDDQDAALQSSPEESAESVELPHDVGSLHAELQLRASRVAAADSFDEIARTLAEPTAGWPAAASVCIWLLEPDGALRMVGSVGLSAMLRSQWERVPAIANVPVVTAVHKRAPVYVPHARSGSPQISADNDGSTTTVAALPLIRREHVLGAIEIAWPDGLTIGKETRDHLFATATPVTKRAAKLAAPPAASRKARDEDPADVSMLPLFVAALRVPSVLLIPQYDQDRIVDFRIEAANPAAAELAAAEHFGPGSASLLTILPDVGSRELLAMLRKVLQTGEPCYLPHLYVDAEREGMSRSYHCKLSAARLWDRVLMTWQIASEAEMLHEPLLHSETTFDTGAFSWDAVTGETIWSPGMYSLTHTDPRKSPLSTSTLSELIHPEDRPSVSKSALDTLEEQGSVSLELRGTGALSNRTIQVSAVASKDSTGKLLGVHGACRDITDVRELTDRARQNRITAAAQRGHLSDASSTIDSILAPLSVHSAVDGISIKGVARGPRDQVLSCWYETIDMPDSSILLLVGEVSGDEPAATVLRLRHAAAAYAVTGMGPAELLAALNTLCCTVEKDRTASLCVVQINPHTAKLAWAASGQAAPIFFRPDRSANIRSGALGLHVGATPGIEFAENSAELAPGEQLVLYTESLMNHANSNLSRTIEAMLSAAEAETPQQAYDQLCEQIPETAESEVCLLMIRHEEAR